MACLCHSLCLKFSISKKTSKKPPNKQAQLLHVTSVGSSITVLPAQRAHHLRIIHYSVVFGLYPGTLGKTNPQPKCTVRKENKRITGRTQEREQRGSSTMSTQNTSNKRCDASLRNNEPFFLLLKPRSCRFQVILQSRANKTSPITF